MLPRCAATKRNAERVSKPTGWDIGCIAVAVVAVVVVAFYSAT
jgi:hypothetical protein